MKIKEYTSFYYIFHLKLPLCRERPCTGPWGGSVLRAWRWSRSHRPGPGPASGQTYTRGSSTLRHMQINISGMLPPKRRQYDILKKPKTLCIFLLYVQIMNICIVVSFYSVIYDLFFKIISTNNDHADFNVSRISCYFSRTVHARIYCPYRNDCSTDTDGLVPSVTHVIPICWIMMLEEHERKSR